MYMYIFFLMTTTVRSLWLFEIQLAYHDVLFYLIEYIITRCNHGEKYSFREGEITSHGEKVILGSSLVYELTKAMESIPKRGWTHTIDNVNFEPFHMNNRISITYRKMENCQEVLLVILIIVSLWFLCRYECDISMSNDDVWMGRWIWHYLLYTCVVCGKQQSGYG